MMQLLILDLKFWSIIFNNNHRRSLPTPCDSGLCGLRILPACSKIKNVHHDSMCVYVMYSFGLVPPPRHQHAYAPAVLSLL